MTRKHGICDDKWLEIVDLIGVDGTQGKFEDWKVKFLGSYEQNFKMIDCDNFVNECVNELASWYVLNLICASKLIGFKHIKKWYKFHVEVC